MNLLWIIGNGFDLNLGLKTSYRGFIDSVYLNSLPNPEMERRRDELFDRVSRLGPGAAEQRDNWADLEKLLGDVSVFYDDISEFEATFEDIEGLLSKYIWEQNGIVGNDIPNEAVDCFRRSIYEFDGSVSEADARKLKNPRKMRDCVSFSSITLNYTTLFDRMVNKMKGDGPYANTRIVDGLTYGDVAYDPLHPHGVVADGGVDSIIFGVSNQEQIKNDEFSRDANFIESWVKQNRNEYYGNSNTNKIRRLIESADLICMFGCSFGETDDYIWRMVGEALKKNSNLRVASFVYGLGDKTRQRVSVFQRKRDIQFNLLSRAFGIEYSEMSDRTVLIPSDKVFQMNLAANVDVASSSNGTIS